MEQGSILFILLTLPQNIDHYQPLLAVGTRTGSVQIFNLSTGVQAFEFSLHTAAVKGIEWVRQRGKLGKWL